MDMPMGSMTPIVERNDRDMIVGHIKHGVKGILEKYMFHRNDSNTHQAIQSAMETYLIGEVSKGNINQFVHSIDYGDDPTGVVVGVAIQPHITDTFIYFNVEVAAVNRSVEDEIAEIMAAKIVAEIDNQIMNDILATADELDAVKTIGTIVGYPHSNDSVDDLADIFDEISDEEFMDIVKVIDENNEEYKKAQSDEAYKHAMGVL